MTEFLGGPESEEKLVERQARYVGTSIENAPSNAICRKLGFELLEACDFELPKGRSTLQRPAARLLAGADA